MTLPTETQNVVKPVMQSNGFFPHTSILLCNMLESEPEKVTRKAVMNYQGVRTCQQIILEERFLKVYGRFRFFL